MSDLKRDIRRFILSSYLVGEKEENLPDDLPLQTSGILDSLATMGLVSYLEKTYSVELTASEIGADRFDRIDDIAALVERKLGAARSGQS